MLSCEIVATLFMTMTTLSHKCHILQQSHIQPPTPTTSPVLLHPHWSPLIFLVSGVQEYKAEHQETYHTRECASIVWVCWYNEPLKLIVLEMPHRYLLWELQMSQAISSVVYHKLEDPIHIRNLEASIKLALHHQQSELNILRSPIWKSHAIRKCKARQNQTHYICKTVWRLPLTCCLKI